MRALRAKTVEPANAPIMKLQRQNVIVLFHKKVQASPAKDLLYIKIMALNSNKLPTHGLESSGLQTSDREFANFVPNEKAWLRIC